MRPLSIALFVVATASWSASAHAQASDRATVGAADHDRAVAAYQDGRRSLEAGDCGAAIPKFTLSLTYEPSIGAHVSLADCYETNDPLAAWRELRVAAHLAFVMHDDRVMTIQARAAGVQPRLAVIRLAFGGAGAVAPHPAEGVDLPGLQVRIDGEDVDPALFPDGLIATTPGGHAVEASTPELSAVTQVTVDAGATQSASLALHPRCDVSNTGHAVAMPGSPSAPVRGARRVVGDVLIGVGVGGLGMGIALGVVSLEKRSALQASCGGDTTRCAVVPGSLDATHAAAETAGAAAIAGFAVAGAALAGGLALYLTPAQASGGAEGHASNHESRPPVALSPMVGKNGQGLALSGAW